MNKINGFNPDIKDFYCDLFCGVICTDGACIITCGGLCTFPFTLVANFNIASTVTTYINNNHGKELCE